LTENHENESILIFHSCSSNLNVGENKLSNLELESCLELHIGNTPRSIMTKGISVTNGTQYGNFIRGNKDKLMISYMRESSHDYTMVGASGVLFEGEIHFFGGLNYTHYIGEGMDFTRQHFVIISSTATGSRTADTEGHLHSLSEGIDRVPFTRTSEYTNYRNSEKCENKRSNKSSTYVRRVL